MTQEKPAISLQKYRRAGCIFGMAAGVGAGYTPFFGETVTEICPKTSPQDVKACWDVAALGTVVAAMLVCVAIAEGIGRTRRRAATPKGPGEQ